MAKVTVQASHEVSGDPDAVYAAVADYAETRPRILTDRFTEYEVREGGRGAGTVAHWKLQATNKRVRDCLVSVTEPATRTLVERDANSSMVTTWTVTAAGEGRSTVVVDVEWQGAGGVGGFFEKTFAPPALRRIYQDVLAGLERHA